MERVYQSPRVYSRAGCANIRRKKEDKPLFSLRKTIFKTIASVLVFIFIYSVNFYDNDFCKRVQNEASYMVNYTVDVQTAYTSAQQIVKYMLGGIEQSRIYITDNVIKKETQESHQTTDLPVQENSSI